MRSRLDVYREEPLGLVLGRRDSSPKGGTLIEKGGFCVDSVSHRAPHLGATWEDCSLLPLPVPCQDVISGRSELTEGGFPIRRAPIIVKRT